MNTNDIYSCETKIRGLLLLSLDGTMKTCETICLHVPKELHPTVTNYARNAFQAALKGCTHISELRSELDIDSAFSDFMNAIGSTSTSARLEISRWLRSFVEDNLQAKADRRFRLLVLDVALNQGMFETLSSFASSSDTLRQLVERHRLAIAESHVPGSSVLLSERDHKVLIFDALQIADSIVYPTLELLGEIATRVEFMQTWRNMVLILSPQGIQVLKRWLRERGLPNVMNQSDAPEFPDLNACLPSGLE